MKEYYSHGAGAMPIASIKMTQFRNYVFTSHWQLAGQLELLVHVFHPLGPLASLRMSSAISRLSSKERLCEDSGYNSLRQTSRSQDEEDVRFGNKKSRGLKHLLAIGYREHCDGCIQCLSYK